MSTLFFFVALPAHDKRNADLGKKGKLAAVADSRPFAGDPFID
jgi:hypothetical protein